jgi:hypothetical protein
MKRFAFSCALLLCTLLSLAQSNFLPGSITKPTGEVENGFIDYKEWSKNPSTINFKKSLDETVSTYSADEILGFEVTGKDKFVRARIKKDMMPVKIQDFNVLPAEKVVAETAFVRELFRNDRIGLFIYRDFKDHFYVTDANGEYVELVYTITPNGADVIENNVFRDQLLTYFPELRSDAKVNKKLERLKYKETDLTQFFYTATNTKAKAEEKIKPVFFAGTGVAIHTLKMSSGVYDIALLDYKTSFSPVLYAGVDIITKRNRGAFVIRPQLSFFNLNFEGTHIRNHPAGYKEEAKHVLKMNNFTISLGGLYNFWNKPKQKVYGGLEVVGNISAYQENELTRQNLTTGTITTDENLMEFESSWFTVNAMAGAIFMKRFEIGVSVRLTGSFSSIIAVNAKPSIYLVKLGYRF